MARNLPRTVSVISTRRLTPNMIRITLGGDELAGFPPDQESGYVKLHFPAQKQGIFTFRSSRKARLRTYTIRNFNPVARELEVDFVVHGDNGPASAWALRAKPGDTIGLTGPGGKKLVDMSADWYFIVGDMTALPAISVNLEQMPGDARGYAVLEVIQEDDCQPLDAPAGIEIHWVVNPHPDRPNSVLADAVRTLPWLDGAANVWLATEFATMRSLRSYFKQERGVNRGEIYASSYWKMGDTDEGNKRAKRNDPGH